MARHVRKGDMVMVISGDHKGATGEVLRVITKADRVVVKGVNMVTRHQKATRINPQGSMVNKEAPLHLSKVQPVVDGQRTRVRFTTKPDGSKVRVAARSGKELGTVSPAKKK